MAFIHGLASAAPDFVYPQSEIYSAVEATFAERGLDLSPFAEAFRNTQIETRHLSAPLSWFQSPRTWQERNSLYISESLKLLEKVAVDALRQSGFSAGEVTDIITISTTGIATPSLEAMLMDRLEFSPTVRRTPVFGLGCAGGLMGLHRAEQVAESDPKNVVLLLVVELCSLNFMPKELSKQNIIATALFADGAAGAVISAQVPRAEPKAAQSRVGRTWTPPRMVASGEHRFTDSLSVMGWNVTDEGLSVIFSRNIPRLVREDFKPVLENFLSERDLRLSDFSAFLSHPGGAKVMDELEALFELAPQAMASSRSVLRRYGNMSAPTVLFVLEDALLRGLTGKALLTTFGPGFSAAMTVLESP